MFVGFPHQLQSFNFYRLLIFQICVFSFLVSFSLPTIFFISVSSLIYLVYKSMVVIKTNSSMVEGILGPLWGAFKVDKRSISSEKNLKVVAHRACGIDAPENSISALQKVIKEGIKAVEFDVMLTSDNIPVVFHDPCLTRMTYGTRMVDTMTYKDLQVYDISVKHPKGKEYTGEKIPTLQEFIECCLENDVKMLIDVKNRNMVAPLIDVFHRYPKLEYMALVSSFDPLVIFMIKDQVPRVMGCLAWRPFYYSHGEYSREGGPMKSYSKNPFVQSYLHLKNAVHKFLLWYILYHLLGLSALLLHKDMISRDVIEYWKQKGVRVLAWTVNSPSEKIYFEQNLKIPYLTDTIIRT